MKYGRARGVQRYLCVACNRQWSNSRRSSNTSAKRLWEDAVFHKQTVRELCQRYHMDKRTVIALLQEYQPPKKTDHRPRPIHILVDATYFGQRTNDTSWCVVVARDHEQGEDLVWRFAETEMTSVYTALREELETLGYTIQSVTGDGFSGIRSAFGGIPFQMCHVHMERRVVAGTTENPQTEAGRVLLALVRTLHQDTTKKTFEKRLNQYIRKYTPFLNEKTINPVTGEKYWTHKELRKASLSLIRFKPYLFTYKANTHIARITNSIEGHFSHINEVLAVHRGLSKSQKEKAIHSLLLASSIAPTQEKLHHIL